MFFENISIEIQKQLIDLFENFEDTTLVEDLVSLKALKRIQKQQDQLIVYITMPYVWQYGFERLQQALAQPVKALTESNHIQWQLDYQIATLKRANNQPAVKGVKNIIAVSSGKGGVGKSTTSVNLALALQRLGARVGLLDADIYGPSIPHMLGATDQRPTSPDNQHIIPIQAHHIFANSIGFLMDSDSATIWRGPMASSALSQLLNETLWPDLDYLVIDMPPGTGDIQLTLSQQIPVTGAIVITTPQDIALLDAIKGIAMFERVNVPVLGIVENMSMHICSECGYHEAIFGVGGAKRIAEKYHTQVLGEMPLHIRLREDLDKGIPTVVATPNHEIGQAYLQLAEKIAFELYRQGNVIPSEIMFREVN